MTSQESGITPAKIMKLLCLGVYFFNINFYLSCCLDPSAAGRIELLLKLYLVLPKGTPGPDDCQAPHQARKREMSQVPLELQIGAHPLRHFTHVNGACLLNRYHIFTGSQVYFSSFVTCRASGDKSFSLDKCHPT